MPYIRKTQDEFCILGYYSGSWEEVTAEDTRAEARKRLKEYRENERGTSFRLKVRRVTKEDAPHEHVFGPIELAHFTGNPHRKCSCGVVSLDLEEEES